MAKITVIPLTLDYAKMVFPYLQNDEIYHYIPDQKYSSVAELERHYKILIQGSENSDELWLNWLIFSKDVDHQVLGNLQATICLSQQNQIGYIIFKDFWNQGYATEAIIWLENYLLENFKIKSIEAYVDHHNIASIKVLNKRKFECITQDQGELYYKKIYRFNPEK